MYLHKNIERSVELCCVVNNLIMHNHVSYMFNTFVLFTHGISCSEFHLSSHEHDGSSPFIPNLTVNFGLSISHFNIKSPVAIIYNADI